jgi:hypothetical protein
MVFGLVVCVEVYNVVELNDSSYVSWLVGNSMIESSRCFQKCSRSSGCRFCIRVCLKSWVDCYTLISCFQKCSRNSGCRFFIRVFLKSWVHCYMLISTHSWELMKSMGSHGSSSLLFVMNKVIIWHFACDLLKVMTRLIVLLTSNCCCGDFSAIS